MGSKDKIKDAMINRTASRCMVSSSDVEKIIDFQGKDASRAVKVYSEVEFVGWGKFMISQSKVKKRISNLEFGIKIVEEQIKSEVSETRKKYLSTKIVGMTETLEFLKNKLK